MPAPLARSVADGPDRALHADPLFVPQPCRRPPCDDCRKDRLATCRQPAAGLCRRGCCLPRRTRRGRQWLPRRWVRRAWNRACRCPTAARPVVAARHPPALARRRIPPRRRRRRPAGRSTAKNEVLGPEDGRHRGPLRHARRPHRRRAEQRSATSTARDSAPCARWSAWWPTKSGSRLGGVHKPQQARRPDHPANRRRREAERPAGRPDRRPAAPWPCAPSRATARCPARSAREASKTPSSPTRTWPIIRLGMFEEAEMAVPGPRRQCGHRLVAHPGRAGHPRPQGRHGRREVRQAPCRSTRSTTPPGNPRLRLVKVASTPFAKPGEEVDFTLRFDNVGNQPIGNVTILDSLSTRLEYVPEQRPVQRRREVLDAAERGRFGGGALRAGQAARPRPRRHPPLPLPRAVIGPLSLWERVRVRAAILPLFSSPGVHAWETRSKYHSSFSFQPSPPEGGREEKEMSWSPIPQA